MKRARFLALAAALCATPWSLAQVQQYPAKPVRIVVPYVAGGNLDVTARLFAQALGEELGQPFVIDNRPGANGNTGTEQIVRSAPDGYNLAMVSAGTLTINPTLYTNMPFTTVSELVAYAKANPGKLNFGSGGNGTLAHLSTEMLRARTGVNIVHVPYKGTSLATNDVMAGHIQVMFDTLSTATPLIKEGKMRAIAVTSAKRSAAFPNVPTIGEAGVKDYVAETWAGLVGPANTPPAVVARLQTAIAKIAANPAIQARLAAGGSEAVGGTSASFASTIKTERVRWAEIVKLSGARATD